MDAELLSKLPGGPALLAWFGYAPRFHDAEVLSVYLDREHASAVLRVHAFEMSSEVDGDGCFVTGKHMVATFSMTEIEDCELVGFNHQNALLGLTVTRLPDDMLRLEMEAAYGLGGFIVARDLSIDLQPGIPPGVHRDAAERRAPSAT